MEIMTLGLLGVTNKCLGMEFFSSLFFPTFFPLCCSQTQKITMKIVTCMSAEKK
jgi:hypothetical protein